jgi:two-component system sensor histidine kinase KdpD
VEENRPDPDALLASIRAEEAKTRRGRLKLFFGMCPGVGKTYAMLQAARREHAAGVEVVVGIVETHGRADTLDLIEGLPVVPRLELEYRGTTIAELDLDAILAWRPRLVLIDELAHTNAPGSRHPKRYQDVLELLEAGIDVFTTLNVQHVESRTDAVRQITGVTVRETVPDSILDQAAEIELVDLTPEQLRQRLDEGKVYLGDRAAAASENFFTEANLSALREMALRLTAEHVDRRLRTLRPHANPEPWRSGDRLMVGVSASPHSAELIRWTRRYAAGLDAPWLAVAVETPESPSDADQQRRATHLALARELGAEVLLVAGVDAGTRLLEVARERCVTHLILGKPEGPVWKWALLGRSPVPAILGGSGGIDVQLIRTGDVAGAAAGSLVRRALRGHGRPREYGVALACVGAVTAVGLLSAGRLGYWSVGLLYLLGVIVAGTRLHRGPTLLIAAASALLWNFLFIEPRFTFEIRAPQDLVMFCTFFVVAIIVGQLASRLHERERLEHRMERRASALYRLTHALAAAASTEEAVRSVCREIESTLGLRSAVVLRDPHGVFTGEAHPAGSWALPPREEAVAAWSFQNRRPAGRGTGTLPEGEALHLPLMVGDRVEGVLALQLTHLLSPEQDELVQAFASQIAVVAEKQRQASARRTEEMGAAALQLQRTLFDTVSHELKTPIAAIAAATDQPQPDRAELRNAVARLRRIVDNLLDVTRIESGMIRPVPEWCDPVELAHEACARVALDPRSVRITSRAEALSIRTDPGLAAQALSVLLDNATTHGRSERPTEVRILAADRGLEFEVRDWGLGLPAGFEHRLFQRFERAPGARPGGLGLGLSIARQLAEALGGSLTGANAPDGPGAIFTLCLPEVGTPTLPA